MFTTHDLLDDLLNMRNTMSRFFGEPGRANYYPAVNIYEDDAKVKVKALVPGLKKEDISIKYENGMLAISGECKPAKDDKSEIIREECRKGAFHKSFKIGPRIDRNSITARLENGVLTVAMNKSEEARAKQIEVR